MDLDQSERSIIDAIWTLISSADVKIQKALYIRLHNQQNVKKIDKGQARKGIDYVRSLSVGKGKVPSWEDGKGSLTEIKYDA